MRGPKQGGTAAWRAWRWVLRLLVGHGYEPWRVLPWLVVTWAAIWALTVLAASSGHMAPTQPPSASPKISATRCHAAIYPCLDPPIYAADTVLPVISLGQVSAWHETGGLRYELPPALARVFGWFLTTLVIAGMTGLVRAE
jgi:hypothetical protein